MKSRKDYFKTRKLLMFLAFVMYCLAFFFFQLLFLVKGGFVTLFAFISILLVGAVLCSIYGHKGKEYLFCPHCGSKRIVKTTLFGIPEILYDECPDCHEKIDVDKPMNKD